MDKGSVRKPPSRRALHITALLIALLLSLIVAAVYLLRPQVLEDIEGRLLDARFKLRGPIETSDLVAIVTVDEKSIETYGRWPWSRERVAELISRLSEMEAGAIGLDIVFSEPQPSPLDTLLAQKPALGAAQREQLRQLLGGKTPDDILAEAICQSGRLVNGHFFYLSAASARDLKLLPAKLEAELLARSGVDAVRARRERFPAVDAVAVRMNVPGIARAGHGSGFFNFIPGRDGIVRDAKLLLRYRGEFYPSLALKTLAFFLDEAPIIVHAEESGIDHIALGGMDIPTDEDGGFVLNYRGPPRTIATYSASDILQGAIPVDAIAGRMVLVGVTAIGVYDAHSTPYGPLFPGLEIQANVAENIILGDHIRHSVEEGVIDLSAIFFILMLLALAMPLLKGMLQRFLFSLSVILAFAWLTLYLFEQQQLWLNLTYPLLAWVLGYITLNVYLTVVIENRLSTVNTAFQYYLHPELVKQLTHQPELLQFGGEQKHLTILFSDIRNFTNLSEGLRPEQLARFIHCYMDPMTEQVLNHRGTLDKYIGDAVMAIFGAPLPVAEHAQDACNAALDMIAELDNIEKCCPELAHIFPIHIGVGIHTGDVVVGNLGSSFHFTYTALGDNVNLTSRLEGLTKAYGVSILISEQTQEALGDKFLCRELDRVRVKGKRIPIRIYELVGRMGEVSDEARRCVERWNDALALYQQQQWQQAARGFETLLNEREKDCACELYIERCEHYRNNPPDEDWDGVTTYTSK